MPLIKALLLILLPCLGIQVQTCRVGWIQNGEKCYLMSQKTESWSDAASICGAFHAKLAEPRSTAEQSFLAAELNGLDHHGTWEYWLGVTDIPVEGRWEYASDGTTIVMAPWGPNEPGGNLVENCVVAELAQKHFGTWSDYPCSDAKHFICEQRNRLSVDEIIG